jgi:hypothetical protein
LSAQYRNLTGLQHRGQGFFILGVFMELKDLWVLEYSPIQGAFNVEQIYKSAILNLSQVTGRRPFCGYVVIFAGTKEQCHAHGELLRTSSINFIGRD